MLQRMGYHITIYSLFMDIKKSFLDTHNLVMGIYDLFVDIHNSFFYSIIHFCI